jgi:hypothetical protein
VFLTELVGLDKDAGRSVMSRPVNLVDARLNDSCCWSAHVKMAADETTQGTVRHCESASIVWISSIEQSVAMTTASTDMPAALKKSWKISCV